MTVEFRSWDHNTYHQQLDYDSFSSLKLFNDNPQRYHQIRTGRLQPKPPTPAMRLGTLVHAMVFEPAAIAERFVVSPKFSGKGSVSARSEFAETHAGFEVYDSEVWSQATAMAESVRTHPWYRAHTEGELGIAERPFTWVGHTGALLKTMPDYLMPETRILLDLKTTSEENLTLENVDRIIDSRLYFAQMAMYADGVKEAYGFYVKPVWVFVSSEPPYESAVVTRPYEDFALGRKLYMRWIERLLECRITGNYTRPGNDKVLVGSMSGWRRATLEQEIQQ